MTKKRNAKIEFGDFQTSDSLASEVCRILADLGIKPDIIVEPTCGVGSFLLASLDEFKDMSNAYGFDINDDHLRKLTSRLSSSNEKKKTKLKKADFFSFDWTDELNTIAKEDNYLLVIGNLPWVTNSGICSIGGTNLPSKSNFLRHRGFEAITGKSNFDISEWMMLEMLKWYDKREGTIAMLLKTSVARKVLAHAEKQQVPISSAYIYKIDTKKEFNASVEACLLIIQISHSHESRNYNFTMFESLDDQTGYKMGYREGRAINNLNLFDRYKHFFGKSPQTWRSGIKHDCTRVMEFSERGNILINGFSEEAKVEKTYLYPLIKGSDVGGGKDWRSKYILVTQTRVGEETLVIKKLAPNTWKYLEDHSSYLDARGSSIYRKNPRFSIFGIGPYAFEPWKIAICALYKKINFRLIGPINGKPVMFDDTVYYISFSTECRAREAFTHITSREGVNFLKSQVFSDEKRPIKTNILNSFDWTRVIVS